MRLPVAEPASEVGGGNFQEPGEFGLAADSGSGLAQGMALKGARHACMIRRSPEAGKPLRYDFLVDGQ